MLDGGGGGGRVSNNNAYDEMREIYEMKRMAQRARLEAQRAAEANAKAAADKAARDKARGDTDTKVGKARTARQNYHNARGKEERARAYEAMCKAYAEALAAAQYELRLLNEQGVDRKTIKQRAQEIEDSAGDGGVFHHVFHKYGNRDAIVNGTESADVRGTHMRVYEQMPEIERLQGDVGALERKWAKLNADEAASVKGQNRFEREELGKYYDEERLKVAQELEKKRKELEAVLKPVTDALGAHFDRNLRAAGWNGTGHPTDQQLAQAAGGLKEDYKNEAFAGLVVFFADMLVEMKTLERDVGGRIVDGTNDMAKILANPDNPNLPGKPLAPELRKLAKEDPVSFWIVYQLSLKGVNFDPQDALFLTEWQRAELNKLATDSRLSEKQREMLAYLIKNNNLRPGDEAKLFDGLKLTDDERESLDALFRYHRLSADERTLARSNPVMFGLLQLQGRGETGRKEAGIIMTVAARLRLDYVGREAKREFELGEAAWAKGNWEEATAHFRKAQQTLYVNQNMALMKDEYAQLVQIEQQLFTPEWVDAKYRDITTMPTDKESRDTYHLRVKAGGISKAQNWGIWVQDLTRDGAAQHTANLMLDRLKAQFSEEWGASINQANGNSNSYEYGEFYKGLSRLVHFADEKTMWTVSPDRASEFAGWLTGEKSPGRMMLNSMRSPSGAGFDPVRRAIGEGHGPELSEKLLGIVTKDGRSDWIMLEAAISNGKKQAQAKANKQQTAADFKLFNADRLKELDKYFVRFTDPAQLPKGFVANDNVTLDTHAPLNNFIGWAMGVSPAAGADNMGALDGHGLTDWYTGEVLKQIKKVAEKIRELTKGDATATVRAVPILYVEPQAGVQPTALFIVTKDGKEHLVDDQGAEYKSWEHFYEDGPYSQTGRIYMMKDRLPDILKPNYTGNDKPDGFWDKAKDIGSTVTAPFNLLGTVYNYATSPTTMDYDPQELDGRYESRQANVKTKFEGFKDWFHDTTHVDFDAAVGVVTTVAAVGSVVVTGGASAVVLGGIAAAGALYSGAVAYRSYSQQIGTGQKWWDLTDERTRANVLMLVGTAAMIAIPGLRGFKAWAAPRTTMVAAGRGITFSGDGMRIGKSWIGVGSPWARPVTVPAALISKIPNVVPIGVAEVAGAITVIDQGRHLAQNPYGDDAALNMLYFGGGVAQMLLGWRLHYRTYKEWQARKIGVEINEGANNTAPYTGRITLDPSFDPAHGTPPRLTFLGDGPTLPTDGAPGRSDGNNPVDTNPVDPVNDGDSHPVPGDHTGGRHPPHRDAPAPIDPVTTATLATASSETTATPTGERRDSNTTTAEDRRAEKLRDTKGNETSMRGTRNVRQSFDHGTDTSDVNIDTSAIDTPSLGRGNEPGQTRRVSLPMEEESRSFDNGEKRFCIRPALRPADRPDVPAEAFLCGAEGILSADGTLKIHIVSRAPSLDGTTSYRVDGFTGTQALNRILQHFGSEVRAIETLWLPGYLGTNFDHFFNVFGRGGDFYAAAGATWTGRQLAGLGYRPTSFEVVPLDAGTGSAFVSIKFSWSSTAESGAAPRPARGVWSARAEHLFVDRLGGQVGGRLGVKLDLSLEADGSSEFHVPVTRIENGQVHFADPNATVFGYWRASGGEDFAPGALVRTGVEGEWSMSLDAFRSIAQDYVYFTDPFNVSAPRGQTDAPARQNPGAVAPPRQPQRFAATDDAAIAALQQAQRRAREDGREWGGLVYRNADGTYGATAAVAGDAHSVNVWQREGEVPAGARVVGTYHTHRDAADFSTADRTNAALNGIARPGFRSYLVNAHGDMQVFDGTSHASTTLARTHWWGSLERVADSPGPDPQAPLPWRMSNLVARGALRDGSAAATLSAPAVPNDAARVMARTALQNTEPVAQPTAILVVGQPGARKSSLINVLAKPFYMRRQGGAVVIDPDQIRGLIPELKEMLRLGQERESIELTNPSMREIRELIMDMVLEGRRNVITHLTMQDPLYVLDLAARLKGLGYRVEIHANAINETVSMADSRLRYEREEAETLLGRPILRHVHETSYRHLARGAGMLERSGTVDAVYVYNMHGERIYSNRQSGRVPVPDRVALPSASPQRLHQVMDAYGISEADLATLLPNRAAGEDALPALLAAIEDHRLVQSLSPALRAKLDSFASFKTGLFTLRSDLNAIFPDGAHNRMSDAATSDRVREILASWRRMEQHFSASQRGDPAGAGQAIGREQTRAWTGAERRYYAEVMAQIVKYTFDRTEDPVLRREARQAYRNALRLLREPGSNPPPMEWTLVSGPARPVASYPASTGPAPNIPLPALTSTFTRVNRVARAHQDASSLQQRAAGLRNLVAARQITADRAAAAADRAQAKALKLEARAEAGKGSAAAAARARQKADAARDNAVKAQQELLRATEEWVAVEKQAADAVTTWAVEHEGALRSEHNLATVQLGMHRTELDANRPALETRIDRARHNPIASRKAKQELRLAESQLARSRANTRVLEGSIASASERVKFAQDNARRIALQVDTVLLALRDRTAAVTGPRPPAVRRVLDADAIAGVVRRVDEMLDVAQRAVTIRQQEHEAALVAARKAGTEDAGHANDFREQTAAALDEARTLVRLLNEARNRADAAARAVDDATLAQQRAVDAEALAAAEPGNTRLLNEAIALRGRANELAAHAANRLVEVDGALDGVAKLGPKAVAEDAPGTAGPFRNPVPRHRKNRWWQENSVDGVVDAKNLLYRLFGRRDEVDGVPPAEAWVDYQIGRARRALFFGDVHFHRLPYNGRRGPNVTIAVMLEKIAGPYARIAFGAIPQNCGKAGHYSNPDSWPLTFENAHLLDQRFAEEWQALTPKQKARADVMLTGFNPIERGFKRYVHDLLLKYPGVFKGIGELTIHKEYVEGHLGPERLKLDNPNLREVFEVAEETGLVLLIHCDWGKPLEAPNGRLEAAPSKYEYFDKLINLCSQYPNARIVLAHTGIGRFVRPDTQLVTVEVNGVAQRVPQHIAYLYSAIERAPGLHFDISWNDVGEVYACDKAMGDALVDFIIANPEKILFGSDSVKPPSQSFYLHNWTLLQGVFDALDKVDPHLSWMVARGNYERLFNEAEIEVAAWTREKLVSLGRRGDVRTFDEQHALVQAERRKQQDQVERLLAELDGYSPPSNPAGWNPVLNAIQSELLETGNPVYEPTPVRTTPLQRVNRVRKAAWNLVTFKGAGPIPGAGRRFDADGFPAHAVDPTSKRKLTRGDNVRVGTAADGTPLVANRIGNGGDVPLNVTVPGSSLHPVPIETTSPPSETPTVWGPERHVRTRRVAAAAAGVGTLALGATVGVHVGFAGHANFFDALSFALRGTTGFGHTLYKEWLRLLDESVKEEGQLLDDAKLMHVIDRTRKLVKAYKVPPEQLEEAITATKQLIGNLRKIRNERMRDGEDHWDRYDLLLSAVGLWNSRMGRALGLEGMAMDHGSPRSWVGGGLRAIAAGTLMSNMVHDVAQILKAAGKIPPLWHPNEFLAWLAAHPNAAVVELASVLQNAAFLPAEALLAARALVGLMGGFRRANVEEREPFARFPRWAAPFLTAGGAALTVQEAAQGHYVQATLAALLAYAANRMRINEKDAVNRTGLLGPSDISGPVLLLYASLAALGIAALEWSEEEDRPAIQPGPTPSPSPMPTPSSPTKPANPFPPVYPSSGSTPTAPSPSSTPRPRPLPT